jgi:predicted Rossmann fold nucleotide-binding protein DprA/Smf involved in DNA uptake
MRDAGWSAPSNVLGRSAEDLQRAVAIKPESAERIVRLLDRAGQLAIELERLADHGVWALAEGDEAYPTRLADRLKERAPPILFGAGPAALLSAGGVAIVGSRDLDGEGETFARALGADCAARGEPVISGGARGTDWFGMTGALDGGGRALGVLAESLLQTLRDAETAGLIRDDQLTLATPYSPAAGFTVGAAMGRNKLLSCLADAAVVVSSADGSGGTWGGAVENLEHRWVPLYVREGSDVPAGNRSLIARGGVPLSSPEAPAPARPEAPVVDSVALAQHHAGTGGDTTPSERQRAGHDGTGTTDDAPPRDAIGPGVDDLFPLVWPALHGYLDEPRTPMDVANRFCLHQEQAKAWLARAADEERVTIHSKRPLRYRRCAPRLL